jgi:Flp pilus assembly protein CpaB
MRVSSSRRAAISASTLFAAVLAIVAGLIFALVFKTVILERSKVAPKPPPPTRKVTVAAVNILDKTQIGPALIKQINLTEAEYSGLVSRGNGRQMLVGNQPVGRTTKQPVRAEEPVYEDQLETMAYPEPVSNRLAPGKRAVVVGLPASAAMVQVGDRVDVLGSLEHNNSTFNNAATSTAVLAKNVKVVARFNSTMTAARPAKGDPNRTYTLEASPFRAGLIELAKNVGATFNLTVIPRQADGLDSLTTATDGEAEDPQGDRVTMEDLARVFGIRPAPPPPPVWTVERYNGVFRTPSVAFPGYAPPGKKGDAQPASREPVSSLPAGPRTVAAAGGNPYGFRPVGSVAKSCPTCGVK